LLFEGSSLADPSRSMANFYSFLARSEMRTVGRLSRERVRESPPGQSQSTSDEHVTPRPLTGKLRTPVGAGGTPSPSPISSPPRAPSRVFPSSVVHGVRLMNRNLPRMVASAPGEFHFHNGGRLSCGDTQTVWQRDTAKSRFGGDGRAVGRGPAFHPGLLPARISFGTFFLCLAAGAAAAR